jgi:hypothetical protein
MHEVTTSGDVNVVEAGECALPIADRLAGDLSTLWRECDLDVLGAMGTLRKLASIL